MGSISLNFYYSDPYADNDDCATGFDIEESDVAGFLANPGKFLTPKQVESVNTCTHYAVCKPGDVFPVSSIIRTGLNPMFCAKKATDADAAARAVDQMWAAELRTMYNFD